QGSQNDVEVLHRFTRGSVTGSTHQFGGFSDTGFQFGDQRFLFAVRYLHVSTDFDHGFTNSFHLFFTQGSDRRCGRLGTFTFDLQSAVTFLRPLQVFTTRQFDLVDHTGNQFLNTFNFSVTGSFQFVHEAG